MTQDPKPPAEQIVDLLRELDEEVTTVEAVLRYRRVRRGRRTVAIPDFAIHRTRLPGLIAQARAAAVPQGSPGWDEDGALSPIASGGGFESQEPVTEAFHLPEEAARVWADIVEDVRAAGYTSPIDAALQDEQLGKQIAARLRAVVAHARVVLKYDAPAIRLPDVYCPDCGGEMRVRADASSAVWCAGTWTVEGPARPNESWPVRVRCGATWPRGSWVKLLEEATQSERIGA